MSKPPHRTIVYIDGFNFYYGVVRGTRWKWLDPQALFSKVLGSQNRLEKVKYFTARVQPSPRDPDVNVRQDTYLRALQAHCPLIELHYGHFLRHRVRMEHANPPSPSVDVWKNEEKGSDVNLALHVLNDAWQDTHIRLRRYLTMRPWLLSSLPIWENCACGAVGWTSMHLEDCSSITKGGVDPKLAATVLLTLPTCRRLDFQPSIGRPLYSSGNASGRKLARHRVSLSLMIQHR